MENEIELVVASTDELLNGREKKEGRKRKKEEKREEERATNRENKNP